MALVGAPPLERCASASSFASEPWFDDHGAVQRRAVAAVKSFVATIIGEDESSNRANLGAEAILLTLQAKKLRKRFGMKSTLEDLENLMMLCSMCGWRKNALKYARKLLELPSCHDDDECFCRTAGRIVTFTRQVFNESSAVQFFEERSRPRCPYQSAWQMPTPHKGYANWLEARSFWDPSRFGVARTMIERRADLLRELRPFARHHDAMRTLWPTSEAASNPELVESGRWRQLSLYRENDGWNTTLCDEWLPVTCSLMQRLADDHPDEFGGKVKLFELGPGGALMPHFGPTNTRLLLHFAVVVPGGGGIEGVGGGIEGAKASGEAPGRSFLRVAEEVRMWSEPGQVEVFDDSFEHEVRNEAATSRLVLAVQLLHPGLGRGELVGGRYTYNRPSN